MPNRFSDRFLKNLGGLGAGPQVRWALRKGIRKSFSESILTNRKTVADPFDFSKFDPREAFPSRSLPVLSQLNSVNHIALVAKLTVDLVVYNSY